MKKSYLLIILTIVLSGFTQCKKNIGTVSGTIMYETTGTHTFTLDATNINATIEMVAGGGGGAGGADYVGALFGTGGGGGGGAGEVVLLDSIALVGGVTYTIVVGEGGAAGVVDANGANGGATTLSLDGNLLYEARAGQGGSSGNDQAGGSGGAGYPEGEAATNGNTTQIGLANSGYGGDGGDNNSGFGKGGAGGKGASVYNNEEGVPADPGNNGTSGYIKIEWVGER